MRYFKKDKAFSEKEVEAFFSTKRKQLTDSLLVINEMLASIAASKKIVEKDLHLTQKEHDTAPFKLLGKYKKSQYHYSSEDVAFYQSLLKVILHDRGDLEENMNHLLNQAYKIKQLHNTQREEIMVQHIEAFRKQTFPTPLDSQKLTFQPASLIANLNKKERSYPLSYEMVAAEKGEVIRFAIAQLLQKLSFKAKYSSFHLDSYKKRKRYIKRSIRLANSRYNSALRPLTQHLQNISAIEISQSNLIMEHFQHKYRHVQAMVEASDYALKK